MLISYIALVQFFSTLTLYLKSVHYMFNLSREISVFGKQYGWIPDLVLEWGDVVLNIVGDISTLLCSIDVISERFNRVEFFKVNFLDVINSRRMQIFWPSLMMRTAVLFQIALKEHIPRSPDNLEGNLEGKSYVTKIQHIVQFPIFEFQDWNLNKETTILTSSQFGPKIESRDGCTMIFMVKLIRTIRGVIMDIIDHWLIPPLSVLLSWRTDQLVAGCSNKDNP